MIGTNTRSAAQIANISSTISGRFSLATAMRAPAGPSPPIEVASRNARSRSSAHVQQLALTEIHRAAVTEAGGGLVEQREQVQRATHSDVSAKSDRYFVELQPPSTTIVWPLM